MFLPMIKCGLNVFYGRLICVMYLLLGLNRVAEQIVGDSVQGNNFVSSTPERDV
jgi:hypothetical protein